MTSFESDFSGSELTFYDERTTSRSLKDFISSHQTVQREALLDFLLFGTMLPPRSPLEGVSVLYPGETRYNGRSKLAYHELSYQTSTKSFDELVAAFDDTLARYFSDGDRGTTVLLSGGIDSAILLSYLPRASTCITWGGKGEQTDDVVYSRITAHAFGVGEHRFAYADFERDLELYKEAVRTLKVPILFNGAVPFLRMADVGKDMGVTTWLVGQNADTLFMSYPAPVLTKHLSLLNTLLPWNPLSLLSSRKSYLFSTASPVRLLAYFKSLGVYPGPWLQVSESYFSEKEKVYWSLPVHNTDQRIIAFEELLTESRRNQLCQNEIPALYGIDAQCPYYERAFIELALSVPPTIRKRGGYTKALLKALAKRRGVPDEVIFKKKSGLSYGFSEFMASKRHLPIWDRMEQDEDLNRIIDIQSLRSVHQENYLTFMLVMSLHYWFELVARPHGLHLP